MGKDEQIISDVKKEAKKSKGWWGKLLALIASAGAAYLRYKSYRGKYK